MPPSQSRSAYTEGSGEFDARQFLHDWDAESCVPRNNDLRTAINTAFKLKREDDYTYHANASVTLAQVQVAIDHGGVNGLHAWYRDEQGRQMPPCPSADIAAYTSAFAPTTSTPKALTSLESNARKGSLRHLIAQHLNAHLLLPVPSSGLALPAKQKAAVALPNPYYDMWAWSCHCLEWAGPLAGTVQVRQSHHVLPIFYHHFGCVVPTWDALSLLSQLARPVGKGRGGTPARPIVEVGSGNGYWACLLQGMGLTVVPVDNAASAWRTTWVGNTVVADGVHFLQNPPPTHAQTLGGPGCKNSILLLVYPQVSADFTSRVIRAYAGDSIVVAGTQNGNGFTGFTDETITAWMERERPQFERVAQVPLPSFAGKDEALFIFLRKMEGEMP